MDRSEVGPRVLGHRDLRGSGRRGYYQAVIRGRLGLLDGLERSPVVASDHRLCHYHHPLCAPIYSVGCVAVPNRGNVHLRLLLYGGLGGALLPVARGGELPDELRVAHLYCVRRDHPGLDIDEDPELHPHFSYRWGGLGVAGGGGLFRTAWGTS